MAAFCASPHDLSVVRDLLSSVDCNVRFATERGYQALSAPDLQLALALTALMTIYIAVFGLRLLLGIVPLRVSDLTVTAIKLAMILVLATSWPTYQQVVFDTLFRGPEQLAASMMTAMQRPDSLLWGNPFDGLQIAFDQMQAAASFFARVSSPVASPFSGGTSFASLALNFSSFLMIFTTLGLVLTAKIVLGLLLALAPLFVAFLLFDNTRGIFEGWLRAALGFALVPLFATLVLVVQLTLLAPHLLSLSQMMASGQPNLPAATAVLMLTLVAATVSLAGVAGLFVVAIGFKLQDTPRTPGLGLSDTAMMQGGPAPGTSQSFQPRLASVSAAVAASDRRDARLDRNEMPRRLNLGADAGPNRHTASRQSSYRRFARPPRSASSVRRDR